MRKVTSPVYLLGLTLLSPAHFIPMHKLVSKVREEFRNVIPPTIFFFIALHIVAFVHALMLKGMGIEPATSMSIAIGALILGKAVLIADMLPMINRFPYHPLIYNVAWKTAIYLCLASFLHYAENLFECWRETGNLVTAHQTLVTKIIWPHFWGVEIILLVLILMYCTMHELIRVIGKEKVKRIFFGPMPIPQV